MGFMVILDGFFCVSNKTVENIKTKKKNFKKRVEVTKTKAIFLYLKIKTRKKNYII